MSKKKTYIILIVIILVFFLVMFSLFGIDNLKKNKYNTTLIVGDSTVWRYNKKNWINVTSKEDILDLNWEKYNVYLNNEEFGKYSLWHDDKWYAFDSKKNAINMDGNILAYKANYDISVFNFSEEEIDNYDVVKQVLEENDIDINSKFTISYKVSFDYDNDEEIEEFYLVTNTFPIDFSPDKIFSLVFMVDGDSIYPIYTDIGNNDVYGGCRPYFTSFLDVDNDKNYEFILSCSRYSVSKPIDMLYDFVDNEFKIIISNQ